MPVTFLGGWYDSYARSTTENYAALAAAKRGPMRLLMGPWVHGIAPLAQTVAGDVDLGVDATIDYNGLRLRFFDQHLKGLDTGLLDEPPVRLFVMGGGSGRRTLDGQLSHGGRWRDEREWPLARTVYTPYYLHADGGLRPERAGPARPTTYRFDPADPVPTVGGNISAAASVMPAGGFDQRGRPGLPGARDGLPLAARHDVLVFQTPPLGEPVEVTGPVTVRLWAASSAVDTDFTANLLDVYPPSVDYPDGYALNLTDSIIRARYRRSWSEPEPLTPGAVEAFELALYPTSNLFAAGHRIRLDISSSNFPRFDVNPNTGEAAGESHRRLVAENTIHHDGDHPSHVILPIIPAT